MEKIQDFLETKKKYEATLWDDQIGFFLLTVIFLGIQILNSRKVFAVCVIIEICLLREKIWKCILQLCSWRNLGNDFFCRWMGLYWNDEETQ